MSGNAMAMPPQGMMGQSMYDMNGMNNMNAMYPPQYPSQMPPQPTMGPGPPMQPPYGNSFYGTGPPVPPPTQPSPMYDPSTQGYYPPNYYGGSMGPPPMPPAPMPTQYPPSHPSSGIPYVPMAPARRETLSSRASVSSGDSMSDSGLSQLSGRVKVNDIKKLQKMGFRRDDIIQALLRTNNDIKRSTELLLEWQRSGRR
eukprot:gene11674-8315_t